MKTNKLVQIRFEYKGEKYTAKVHRDKTTAIVLPNNTILKTSTMVIASGPRRRPNDKTYTRSIFDPNGQLLPIEVLRLPGDCNIPFDPKFPVVLASQI